MAKAQKRGPGRPAVYTGATKKTIVSAIRKLGLTGARNALMGKGGFNGLKVKVSLPTLGKFAAEAGIELQVGRPAGEGSEKPAKPAKKAPKAKAEKKPAKKVKAKAKKPAAKKAAKPAEVAPVETPVVESAPVVEAPAETAPASNEAAA